MTWHNEMPVIQPVQPVEDTGSLVVGLAAVAAFGLFYLMLALLLNRIGR